METAPQAVAADTEKPTVRQLSKTQRRVLGVLVEKGFTTPEYYPLTLKAATTGCNQKSNRSPITHYSEDTVEETMDELRKLGLVAVVHTESGRTERYRHFMRQRYPFTETQLAIITELLLRGCQQTGELRSRASRMAPIASLDELRADLRELARQGYVQSSGPLERRGIDVAHTLYEPHEPPVFGVAVTPPQNATPSQGGTAAPERAASPERQQAHREETASAVPDVAAAVPSVSDAQVSALVRECADLREGLRETREEMESLREQVTQLSDELSDLRRDLGA